jgi:hypothetical protein
MSKFNFATALGAPAPEPKPPKAEKPLTDEERRAAWDRQIEKINRDVAFEQRRSG